MVPKQMSKLPHLVDEHLDPGQEHMKVGGRLPHDAVAKPLRVEIGEEIDGRLCAWRRLTFGPC